MSRLFGFAFLLISTLLFSTIMSAQSTAPTTLNLEQNWFIQTSEKVSEPGSAISAPGFKTDGWLGTKVPSTVFAAQLNAGVFKDAFYGMNLRKIPGVSYPIGSVFSAQDMPADSPYNRSWWYRSEFTVPASAKGRHAALNFKGIGYRANIWFNGKQLATSKDAVGTFRHYQFDVDDSIRFGEPNVIAVEVFPAQALDLGYNWVDWNPSPPDKEMGLWREVYFTFTGTVDILNPLVTSEVDKSLASAALTVVAELRNSGDQPVSGTLKAGMPGIDLQQNVTVNPGETKEVVFDPKTYQQLVVKNPKLWWPAQMGEPNLHTMNFEFVANGEPTDTASLRFGIRQVTDELTDKGARLFRINGKPILIRGGGWTPDMALRFDRKRLEEQMRYVLDMNLNTVRLEGKMEDPYLYDLADQWGILLMTGWCCCDQWEHWEKWTPENYPVAYESLKSQLYDLRARPSVFVWLNGSDNPPAPDVEKKYLEIAKQLRFPNPIVSSATQKPSTVTGATGVKMTGPYDYVPPVYWTEDKDKLGGAWSFNTETSAGASPFTLKSLKRTIPLDSIWPVNDVWNFHAGGGEFKTIKRFQNAMNKRYGEPKDVVEFTYKGQAMAYENVRAMFEAYTGAKYTSTGVIQWMLNNAWPGMFWHLYDYYLTPDGNYFGAKKANEPVHAQYTYADRSVAVVNSTYQPVNGLKLSVRVLNFDMTEKFNKSMPVDVGPDAVVRPITLPAIDGLSGTYFVRLDLTDATGKPVSTNFYWLSTKRDIVDYTKHTFYDSPTTQWGDFTMMNKLPQVKPQVQATLDRSEGKARVRVTIENPSKALAFMTHLAVAKGEGGEDVAPIVWSDNYVSLLPGEKRELTGTFNELELGTAAPVLEVDGWNTALFSVPLK